MSPSKSSPEKSTPKPAAIVVGLGASAGGVEALSAFFDHQRNPSAAAFLVAMHLAATRASHLPQILARHTAMPVALAEHGALIEADRVYVGPPGMVMTIKDKHLQLSRISDTERVPTGIDRFFNSLADSYAECAIGVMLSGTGADGAMGLKAVNDRGGLTIAQGENATAPLFSGMPESAIAAGAIVLELPVEDMGPRLATLIARMLAKVESNDKQDAQRLDELRQQICALILSQTGHDFSGYKPATFFRRVHRRMVVLQISDVETYVSHMRESANEVTLLFRDLLISVTSFFRDKEAFATIQKEVIPALFRDKGRQDELRVWVPGCATGEEAYSLAILLLEHADALGSQAPAIRVFATDIDERALNIARNGRYPSVLLDEVSGERRQGFFTEESETWVVQKELREVCTFSPHNVLRDPPFSRIDLVSCRNLLIYLGQGFQDRVLPILHYALRPEGFLFVGVAEGVTRHDGLFESVSKSNRIFRKLPGPGLGEGVPLLARGGARNSATSFAGSGVKSENAVRRQIEVRILQSHAPPYVLVNGDGVALFYSTRTGNYLEFSPGAPSSHLLSNARKELRLGLRRALQEVASTQERVTMPETIVANEDGARRVQVSIEPFDEGGSPRYLVLFNDRGAASVDWEQDEAEGDVSNPQLKRDLRDARDQLQSTYEEFQTAFEELRVANEELMSVNEELQSSNEELENSKEELQSVNEELQTVNNQMAKHVEALDQSNADLSGLLEITGIATIFLDHHLAIRRYTRAATEIFTLIPSDEGRRITDLNHALDDLHLADNLRKFESTQQPLELTVQRKDDSRHYLMRLLPYRGASDETRGVVMTFVDITALAQADGHQKLMIGELNHRVRNMMAVVSAMAQQTMANRVPAEALEAFLSRLQAMTRTYRLLTETSWSHMDLADMLDDELGAMAGCARYELSGPQVRLEPRAAMALGMAIHELATNALKHGALSVPEGTLRVTWSHSGEDQDGIDLRWTESGGPPVQPPTHRGFGSLLLERQLAYELAGSTTLDFAREGLRVKLRLPLASLTSLETTAA